MTNAKTLLAAAAAVALAGRAGAVDKKPLKGFAGSIDAATLKNEDFRRVLYTGRYLQLVLMSLPPGGEIGAEVHETTDQFIRVEKGRGQAVIDGVATPLEDGSAVLIPAGARHNVKNTGKTPLKLYTLYGPPEHRDGVVRATKKEAEESEEHFDGKTTEGPGRDR